MTLRWFVDGALPPRQVECHSVGYPHEDVEGNVQCVNTHFDDEDEAWVEAGREAQAWAKLAARSIERAEADLAQARCDAGEAAKAILNLDRAKRDRERNREAGA